MFGALQCIIFGALRYLQHSAGINPKTAARWDEHSCHVLVRLQQAAQMCA
jgi:hypothetical protein